MTEDENEELLDRIERLERRMDALVRDHRSSRSRSRFPQPPSIGELVRFTDDYVLPAGIAFLETNRRFLELIQGSIKLIRQERRTHATTSSAPGQPVDLGRRALVRLDEAIEEAQTVLQNGRLPRNEEARSIMQDARAIRAEIERRLEELEAGDQPSGDDDPEMESPDTPGEATTAIDVDSELESIKSEMADDDPTNGDGDKNHSDGTADTE